MTAAEFAQLGLVIWSLVFGLLLLRSARRHRRVERYARGLRAFRSRARTTTGEIVDTQVESVTTTTAAPAVVSTGSQLEIGSAYVPVHGLLYRPIIQYQIDDGPEVKFAGHQPSARSFITGKRVPVSYDPTDPENAEITGERPMPRSWASFLGVLVAAAFLLGGDLYFLAAYIAIRTQDQHWAAISMVGFVATLVAIPVRIVVGIITPTFQKQL